MLNYSLISPGPGLHSWLMVSTAQETTCVEFEYMACAMENLHESKMNIMVFQIKAQ